MVCIFSHTAESEGRELDRRIVVSMGDWEMAVRTDQNCLMALQDCMIISSSIKLSLSGNRDGDLLA